MYYYVIRKFPGLLESQRAYVIVVMLVQELEIVIMEVLVSHQFFR